MTAQEQQFETLIEGILTNGYGICDNFLSEIEVQKLLQIFFNRYEKGQFKAAGIGKTNEVQQIESIRGDEILWLESDTKNMVERAFLDKNQQFVDYLNQTCFLGIKETEIHFAKYDIGKFYRRHRDTFQTKKGRVLSIIYYLNSEWLPEDGGNLVIYINENNQEKTINIAPLAGRLVCFESEKLDHEVKETFKARYSITGWLARG